ncbi:exopolyphosphatase [Nitrosomonas sp. Nm58]|jgi:exopolyphosphatase/guanosine-5'-triphosphate,3'-diphosphate pyrophosphatase|uniref:exopolyphosphatase n=1 Tax=Nitrosomonas sp. Nm58 TaxID=200126 RepID=UPI00089BADA0|nr:exopolyphosphatase [Nitrosomonas sp. Nm58]SDY52516.1 exopolyphosphatase / guanosine-5'-triphosphate,3'-diphosphate pyrophosphatase [Nitrosomonas sp. Nm58]
MREYSTLAAVDLGSNSFHLQVSRVVGKQLYPLDSLKEMVRLAAGLTIDKKLDEACQVRALDCLKRFSERLRGFPTHAVRVVGTNSLRVAKNASDFLVKAETVLGFPIEIIAGHEEARLIYLGVAHSLPASDNNRLIIDIGGGSTEFIIGTRLEPNKLESLYMGCVSHSLLFFPDGKITKGAMKRAELAAQTEIQSITTEFSADQWQEVYGSSGTARALGRILKLNNYGDRNKTEGITLEGLEKFREYLLKVGDIRKIVIAGLHPDRTPVIAGGFAIMYAAFKALGIQRMRLTTGALRQGVLYDMLGRFHNEDMREVSVQQFMQRYRVDPAQAARIESLALVLGKQLLANYPDEEIAEDALRLLSWAAHLHEVGISVAHSGYHKHSAYILGNADIPGFSKMEQMHLSQLVLVHQGSLTKVSEFLTNPINLAQSIALRLATIFYRSRTSIELPSMKIQADNGAYELFISQTWLERNPLTETLLRAEIDAWAALKIHFCIQSSSPKKNLS